MSKSTQAFKTSMTVMRGGNVPVYTLEYLAPVGKKKPGSYEKIVVPYAELGRSKQCVISFGDDTPTVSRKHAAIERRGDKYYLLNLSGTNPTFINGSPISQEYELNNSDEIQLSKEGPKLRFNISASGTSGMGFTQRMGLVTKQALKPYRKLITTLVIVLIGISVVGGIFIYKLNKKNQLVETELTQTQEQMLAAAEAHKQQIAATLSEIKRLEKENANLSGTIGSLKKEVEQLDYVIEEASKELEGKDAYSMYKNDVFFLQVEDLMIQWSDGETYHSDKRWTGTAFLCSDGKLVTARHCLQAWRYNIDEESQLINYAELNGGNVFVKYKVTSPNNSFTFNYSEVVFDDSHDQEFNDTDVDGTKYTLKFGNDFLGLGNSKELFSTDWAYVETTNDASIEINADLSHKLSTGEELFILGFSLGIGGSGTSGEVTPLYSEANVAMPKGKDGIITISDRNFESGNSGGPAFVKEKNKFYVVGIVSYAEGATSIGGLVPIGNLK